MSDTIPPAIGEEYVKIADVTTNENPGSTVEVKASIERKAIPIIFLPGIMGTNLRSKKHPKTSLWMPPNTTIEKLSALGEWEELDAAARQSRLNKDIAEIDPDGPIDLGKVELKDIKQLSNATDDKEAAKENQREGVKDYLRKRRWGTVMKSSYHPIMGIMQTVLNRLIHADTVYPNWSDDPTQHGALSGSALTKAELNKAAKYHFDVWGGGYNWLQSNEDSARDIQKFIDEEVLKYYKDNDIKAEKVILVTHSMGGLVARALAKLVNYDKILGVVHGVMPASGAPATYNVMRQGYSGIEQIVLGRNAGEVTAVTASSPGALQLLPWQEYGNGKAWLKVKDGDKELMALPTGDPFTQIYHSTAWYGLVPEQATPEATNQLIDPAKIIREQNKEPRRALNDNLLSASQFQTALSMKYHDETYVHYGDDPEQIAYAEVVWKGSGLGEDVKAQPLTADDYDGEIKLNRTSLTIDKPSGAGDGTVPSLSGEAPKPYVKMTFMQKGYDHQNSYNAKSARWATLYSVIKIAQKASW